MIGQFDIKLQQEEMLLHHDLHLLNLTPFNFHGLVLNILNECSN